MSFLNLLLLKTYIKVQQARWVATKSTEKDMRSLAFLQMQCSFQIILCLESTATLFSNSVFFLWFFPLNPKETKTLGIFPNSLIISLWNATRTSHYQFTVIKSRAQTKHTRFCIDKGFLPFELLSQVWPIVTVVLALSLKMPVPLSESLRALSLWASAISCGFNKKQLICLEASKYTEELEPNCFYLFLLVHCALSLGVENLVDHLCSPFFSMRLSVLAKKRAYLI